MKHPHYCLLRTRPRTPHPPHPPHRGPGPGCEGSHAAPLRWAGVWHSLAQDYVVSITFVQSLFQAKPDPQNPGGWEFGEDTLFNPVHPPLSTKDGGPVWTTMSDTEEAGSQIPSGTQSEAFHTEPVRGGCPFDKSYLHLHSGCCCHVSPSPPASPPCIPPAPHALTLPPQMPAPTHKHPRAQPGQLRAAPVNPPPQGGPDAQQDPWPHALPPAEGIPSRTSAWTQTLWERPPGRSYSRTLLRARALCKDAGTLAVAASEPGTRTAGAPGAAAQGGGARPAPGSTRRAPRPLHAGPSPAELAPGHKACCSGNPLNGFWTHKDGSV